MDLRRNFEARLDELAGALKEYIGETAVYRLPKPQTRSAYDPTTLRRAVLLALLTTIGLVCLSGMALAARYAYGNLTRSSEPVNTPATLVPVISETAADIVIETLKPGGKIVYTCQVTGDEICLIQADGTGWQRLTDTPRASYNASLSPDGTAVVFVSGQGDQSEIYELDLGHPEIRQLTELGEYVTTPEISPNGRHILFTYRAGGDSRQVWIMNRDGSNPHVLYRYSGRDAHNATWSPDGSRILFAFGRGDNNQLYVMDPNGQKPTLVNDSVDTRGHSSWSVNDLITLDMGGSFMHDIYVMNLDRSDLHQVSQSGNNAQGESFSPDGEWIAYSA